MLCILVSSNFFACQDDDLEDQSIFDASEKEKSEFDRWLLENYVNPYNIDFKYRMEHIESDYTHNLVPTDFWLSVKLAKIVKHCWLEAYDEVGGLDFTRACAPKVIHLIGSASWDKGTYTLGTAEGGLKVTLYMGNWLDLTNVDRMNEYYFKVMHHEFAHILHHASEPNRRCINTVFPFSISEPDALPELFLQIPQLLSTFPFRG